MNKLVGALRELVELKEMKEQIRDMAFKNTQHAAEVTEDYELRKLVAWQKAREALALYEAGNVNTG